ncbi:hypothetical protein ACO2Q3_02895 [Caulobacter sp. KR2-114]|uniref:hypothetical protein n=1 Tax=Caulobacter sp. KR2-114 TaxID=3400912 RepID=UPI003C0F4CE5
MKAVLAVLIAAGAIAGAASAQDDPDQSFHPGPAPSDQAPIPPSPTGDRSTPDRSTPDRSTPDRSASDRSTPDRGDRGPDRDHGGPVLTADMLGDRLAIDELDGAWVGTWTRRPGTDTFDAVWRNRQGQEAHDVIRLVGVAGGQVTFRRDGVSGPAGGTYTGTLAADGRTIVGTASWYQPGWVWRAVIGDRADRDHGGPDRTHREAQTPPVSEVQLADTWNTGGCGFTDTATLDLGQSVRLSRISLWYNWQPGEREVRYTVSLHGRQVGGGVLTRGDCDPYQGAWCEARDTPDADLQAGQYRFQLERGHLCQNGGSGGAGFIRAWGYPTGGSVEQRREDARPAVSLSGVWSGNDGGRYVVRQDGDRIRWTGVSGDGGRTFINDFEGRIEGDRIIGHFQDRPGAAVHSSGDLVLRIEGPDRFVMVTPSGGFGGSVWTR